MYYDFNETQTPRYIIASFHLRAQALVDVTHTRSLTLDEAFYLNQFDYNVYK